MYVAPQVLKVSWIRGKNGRKISSDSQVGRLNIFDPTLLSSLSDLYTTGGAPELMNVLM